MRRELKKLFGKTVQYYGSISRIEYFPDKQKDLFLFEPVSVFLYGKPDVQYQFDHLWIDQKVSCVYDKNTLYTFLEENKEKIITGIGTVIQYRRVNGTLDYSIKGKNSYEFNDDAIKQTYQDLISYKHRQLQTKALKSKNEAIEIGNEAIEYIDEIISVIERELLMLPIDITSDQVINILNDKKQYFIETNKKIEKYKNYRKQKNSKRSKYKSLKEIKQIFAYS